MKKLIALVIAALMILSMIPVMAISTSAAVEGDWNVLRNPQTYEDEAKGEIVVPAPGYEGETKICTRLGLHHDNDRSHPGFAAIMIAKEKL